MRASRWILILAIVVGFAGFAQAGDDSKTVTVTGKIVCAKCTLQKADAKECQNVLVAEKDGKPAEYYIAKNEVAEKFGHVCQGAHAATVTGETQEKDGKKWITASKMVEPEE